MPTGTVWPLADKIAGGQLASILLEAHARKLSPARIAQELYASHGIGVSDVTVRSWLEQLDEERAP